jgi:hypothetical protein
MMDAQTVSLVLGDFYLHGGPEDSFTVSVYADGVDFGSPQAVDTVVETLLQNSSSVITDRYDNREVTVRVGIKAVDGSALAEAEAALFSELGRPNTLTWTPPATYAPPTVFRVVTSSMVPTFDDLQEMRGWRVYTIRFVCEAFARSVDEVVTEAEFQPTDEGEPVTPIDTLVDNCSSATGWSAVWSGSSVTVDSGAVRNDPTYNWARLRRTGSIDMSSTPLLVVDVKVGNGGGTPYVEFNGDGDWADPIGSGSSAYSGYKRYWFNAPASITKFEVGFLWEGTKLGRIWVAEVRKQNNPPASGTFRQKYFTAQIDGSAPSDGTIEVYHAEDALSDVLLYTYPPDGQGFVPALRPLLSASGSTTLDADLASGGRNDLASTAVSYDIPAEQVTVGTYEVGALLKSNATGDRDIDVDVSTRFGSDVVGTTSFTKTYDFDATGTWYYVPLGRIELPLNRVGPDTEAVVRVTLSSPDASGIDVDETYLFNVESGALTVVACDTSTRLWVNAATLDWPMPTIMRGTLEDKSDSFAPIDGVTAWGVHEITPPAVNVFAVTRGAVDAGVRLTYTPAWHTHAAQ